MTPRLFCFAVLASHFPYLSLATPALQVPGAAHGFVGSMSSSAAGWLGAIGDFKDAGLIRSTELKPPMAVELPRKLHMDMTPHDAFPRNEKLSDIASQQAVWVKQEKGVEPLSAETFNTWAPHGEEYKALDPNEKKELAKWLESSTKLSKEEYQIAKRIEWSLEHSKDQVWWDSKLVKAGNFEAEENNRKLIEIGNLLQFGQKEHNYQLTDQEIRTIIPTVYKILSKASNGPTDRKTAVGVNRLVRFNDDLGKPLYEQRMTQVLKFLIGKEFPRQVESDKIKSLETLYLITGESPQKAAEYSPKALKALSGADYRAFMPNPAKADFQAIKESLKRLRAGVKPSHS